MKAIGRPDYPFDSQLDQLDYAIIDFLRDDGRMPLTELGHRLGVSHATVRNRLERLVAEKVIRITAVVDPAKVGFDTHVLFGITGGLKEAPEIEKALAEFEETSYVATTSGRLDFIAAAAFSSDEELREFLIRKLSKVRGIRATETFHILNLVKRTWQWKMAPRKQRNGSKAETR